MTIASNGLSITFKREPPITMRSSRVRTSWQSASSLPLPQLGLTRLNRPDWPLAPVPRKIQNPRRSGDACNCSIRRRLSCWATPPTSIRWTSRNNDSVMVSFSALPIFKNCSLAAHSMLPGTITISVATIPTAIYPEKKTHGEPSLSITPIQVMETANRGFTRSSVVVTWRSFCSTPASLPLRKCHR